MERRAACPMEHGSLKRVRDVTEEVAVQSGGGGLGHVEVRGRMKSSRASAGPVDSRDASSLSRLDGDAEIVVRDSYAAVECVTRGMWELAKLGKFSDITICCEGYCEDGPDGTPEPRTEFAAHRAVLVAGSSLFEAMLSREGTWREADQNLVTMQDVARDDMAATLEFIYTGSTTIPRRSLRRLCETADKLGVSSLRSACAALLAEGLSQENCLPMLEWAEELCISDMRASCMDFLLRHFEEMLSVPSRSDEPDRASLDTAPVDLLKELIASDRLRVSGEEVILEWLVRLHDRAAPCELADVLSRIQELLPLIRFPRMDAHYLSTTVYDISERPGWEQLRPLLTEALRAHTPGVTILCAGGRTRARNPLPLTTVNRSLRPALGPARQGASSWAGRPLGVLELERTINTNDASAYLTLTPWGGSHLVCSKSLPGAAPGEFLGALELWNVAEWKREVCVLVSTHVLSVTLAVLPPDNDPEDNNDHNHNDDGHGNGVHDDDGGVNERVVIPVVGAGPAHRHHPRAKPTMVICGGCLDGTVRVWSLPHLKELRCWQAHRCAVTMLAVTGSQLLSSSCSGVIFVWRLGSWVCERFLRNTLDVGSMVVCGKKLVSGHVWDTASWACLNTMNGDCRDVTVLSVLRNKGQPRLVIGYSNGGVEVWDTDSWTRLVSFPAHMGPVRELRLIPSPDESDEEDEDAEGDGSEEGDHAEGGREGRFGDRGGLARAVHDVYGRGGGVGDRVVRNGGVGNGNGKAVWAGDRAVAYGGNDIGGAGAGAGGGGGHAQGGARDTSAEILSCGENGVMRVWDTSTWECLLSVEERNQCHVAFCRSAIVTAAGPILHVYR